MRRFMTWALLSGLLTAGGQAAAATTQELAKQVRDAETAFAKSMADRDLAAFTAHVAEEAVFFGGRGPLRGREAVVAAWKRFFEGDAAPFSWEPETVEVLDSGTLALSSGPVRDPEGTQIAIFQSIWRLDADGAWRVVFDKGCDYCPPPETKP
jgi:ketosteroid isomerase-like protein